MHSADTAKTALDINLAVCPISSAMSSKLRFSMQFDQTTRLRCNSTAYPAVSTAEGTEYKYSHLAVRNIIIPPEYYVRLINSSCPTTTVLE